MSVLGDVSLQHARVLHNDLLCVERIEWVHGNGLGRKQIAGPSSRASADILIPPLHERSPDRTVSGAQIYPLSADAISRKRERHGTSSDVVRSAWTGRRETPRVLPLAVRLENRREQPRQVRPGRHGRLPRHSGRRGADVFRDRPWVTFYLETPDITASLNAAQKLGGKVVMPRTVTPDVTMGAFEDPEGHVIGLVEAQAS